MVNPPHIGVWFKEEHPRTKQIKTVTTVGLPVLLNIETQSNSQLDGYDWNMLVTYVERLEARVWELEHGR